jgi:tyrosyl-tRNA synthetase
VGAAVGVAQLLKDAGLVASVGEARRLIEQGGVKLDGARIGDTRATVPTKGGILAQVGKRRIAKILFRAR